MLSKKEKKALIGNLPDDWKEATSSHFGKSISYVEKVCYGLLSNLEVFEHLVNLAENNKSAKMQKEADLKERIQKLSLTE